ncbi:uncharacterized protein LOC103309071 [Acyrthosiphon pisum]|uniref:Uncharacterized protein n=1 Tax=Acyrthosiphon pisum TaxID=7029 RepID=A0A8R2B4S5_ACYPI|nr:uncharacterized protein LOC103309071 [Acyrthosiphon pisum]|eukprot:XP_008181858.1 PREDICTED: uncharacterized protein LOC103309071 [Acyrthosiphon pisum]
MIHYRVYARVSKTITSAGFPSYVGKSFNNVLPHTQTIQKWYESVDCAPGFSKDALVALQNKMERAEKIGHKFSGYVDFGADIADDSTLEAKEALVIMVNYVNGH